MDVSHENPCVHCFEGLESLEVGTYPKRTPPKVTKKPMAMAGHDLPGTPSGFLSDKPMLLGGESVLSCERRVVEEGKAPWCGGLKMRELKTRSTEGSVLALYDDEA